MRPKRIPADVLAAAVASRDPDELIELLRPFVARPPGAPLTVGYRRMTPDERREYNKRRQAERRQRLRKGKE